MRLCYDIFNTPLGPVLAASDEDGICLLEFSADSTSSRSMESLSSLYGEKPARKKEKYLGRLEKELSNYFSGSGRNFTVPVVLHGTAFQKEVWNELRTIPYGERRSYLDQARSMGRPDAIRAVARANGANLISIIIPCHRVLGSNGKLTGYAGGLWRKKWLLEHENKYRLVQTNLTLF